VKKIIFACIIVGLVFSFSGTSFSGSGNKHKKMKGHKKEYCKKYNKRHGPPPHAPAHGYRHKHSDGVDLKFISDRGVYIVIDFEDHYFHGDHFYRNKNGKWRKSKHIAGPWLEAQSNILPPGLPPLPPPPPKPSFWKFFSQKN